MLLKPGRLIFLAIVGAGIWAGLHYGSWITAQARAAGALATAYETPLVSWATRKLTDDPELRRTTIAGIEVTMARPGGEGPWPAVLLLNGATGQGRLDPDVLRLALGLARVGHLVVLPDVPALAASTVTSDVAGRVAQLAAGVAARPDARDGKVAFVGLGLGGTFALLAAQDTRLAADTSLVIAISPITDFVEIGRLVTTGFHRVPGGFVRRSIPAALRQTAADTVVAALPAGRERDLIAEELDTLDPDSEDPLAKLAEIPPELVSKDAAALIALLTNRDPRAYDAIVQRLPAGVRATLDDLSPVRSARAIRAPVELAVAASDPLIPLAQARALERANPNVRVTISDAFTSTSSRPRLGGPGEFLTIDALVVRSLRHLRR